MDKNITTKLVQLAEIQKIDTHLDAIVKLRGNLPEEVDTLEEGIASLYSNIKEHESLLITLREDMVSKKASIKSSEKKIQQYESQQMDVRNNREYDAITKELELHKLDIQLAEKFLRTAYEQIEQGNATLVELNKLVKLKESDLIVKKEELEVILKESEAEEDALHKKRKGIVAVLGQPLYLAYEKIRHNVKNNLAVVAIKKGACGGCCIVIPPQQKLGVYERSKIVLCEHCGRMLVAPEQPADSPLFINDDMDPVGATC